MNHGQEIWKLEERKKEKKEKISNELSDEKHHFKFM